VFANVFACGALLAIAIILLECTARQFPVDNVAISITSMYEWLPMRTAVCVVAISYIYGRINERVFLDSSCREAYFGLKLIFALSVVLMFRRRAVQT
jgi:hypothetical protein